MAGKIILVLVTVSEHTESDLADIAPELDNVYGNGFTARAEREGSATVRTVQSGGPASTTLVVRRDDGARH